VKKDDFQQLLLLKAVCTTHPPHACFHRIFPDAKVQGSPDKHHAVQGCLPALISLDTLLLLYIMTTFERLLGYHLVCRFF
jgi:hypothetical protein